MLEQIHMRGATCKVFLAWSGPASERLAELMREWLPAVVPAIEPFMSSSDVRKDQRWASEIGAKLAEAQCALLCLTPLNLSSRWIHFEAGAVSQLNRARVSALLLDVSPTQIEHPLQQFQHTILTKGDLWNLVQDLNAQCATPLSEARLRQSFARHYGQFEAGLANVRRALAQERSEQAEHAGDTERVLANLLALQTRLASKLDAMGPTAHKPEARRPSVVHRLKQPKRSKVVPISTKASVIASRLGAHVRERRMARGLSQEALARKADIDRTYLSQLERGCVAPTVTVLCKLSGALGVSPSLLLAGVTRRAM